MEGKIKYWLSGDKDSDTAVIICHGFPSNSSTTLLTSIQNQLSIKYLVCRFDFKGSGQSGGNFYKTSISTMLNDLSEIVALIETLGNKKIILMGHSFGAAICMLFTERHTNKVSGLISLSGEGDLQKAISFEFNNDQIKEFEKNGKTTIETWVAGKPIKKEIGLQFLEDMRKYSTNDAAKLLSMPTLLIHGSKDELKPKVSRKINRIIPKPKKLVIIHGADHFYNSFFEKIKLDEVIAEINLWIEKYIVN